MKRAGRFPAALTNKRDEDPRNESSTLNLLLVNVIAVGFYIPTHLVKVETETTTLLLIKIITGNYASHYILRSSEHLNIIYRDLQR